MLQQELMILVAVMYPAAKILVAIPNPKHDDHWNTFILSRRKNANRKEIQL